ncbi:MAG: acireductone synthase [Panacagrimonas sp.]
MVIRAVLVDIEGTTSSIDFVHQTLFPYASRHLRGYLKAHAGEPDVQKLIGEVKAIEGQEGAELSLDAVADILEGWIAQDRKLTPLKTLQGLVWAQGYAAGELKGHVYADTPAALRRWHAQGLRTYVYSSGSVAAQKLIFGHTEYGDLTPLFSGFFDTQVGGKREELSYREILRQINLPADQVLFLSDVGEELDAARAAGMQTQQLIRDDKARPFAAHAQAPDLSRTLG